MLEKLRPNLGAQPLFDVAIEPSFDFLSPEYRALFDASDASAFQHPLWLDELYRKLLAPNSATPLVIVIRHPDRSLAMVLPLIKRRYAALRVVEFADLRVSDFVAPVVEGAVFDKILSDSAALARVEQLLRPYDLLRVSKLDASALPMYRLFGRSAAEPMATNAYAVPLEGDLDAWRAKYLDRSYAKELDKKGRQLDRKGKVEFACVMAPADIMQTFAALKIFRRDRFELNGGGELLQIAEYFDFYNSIGMAGDFARVYRLSLDGKPIGGAVGLAHRGAFLVIMVGFTQTEFKNQSVGSLVLQQVARDCIARGERLLDFTIGDEPYKLIFGAKPRPMLQMSKAGSPVGFLAGTMVDRLPAAKSLARSLFHRGGKKARPADAASTIGDVAAPI